jgi:hypothetical protein
MMTGKERLLATLRGERPDTVPFAPNLYHWFYYHRARGTLPPVLYGATHPYQALRALGAEILARWDTQWATREVYTAGKYSRQYVGDTARTTEVVLTFNTYPPGCDRGEQEFVTPFGTLTQEWTFERDTGTEFETKHWWIDFDAEYRAVRYMLEAKEFEFDAALFHSWVERTGDDGLVMLKVNESPLKMLHWLAGQERASYFIYDHPQEMLALARIHTEKTLAYLERVADNPDALIFISNDNLDSMFYSPAFFRDFCQEFFTRAAEIVHRRGKFFFVHSCGRVQALLPLVGQTRVDCLEGVTPPPIGNVRLADVCARVGYDNFTVNGGMSAVQQEIGQDAERLLHNYTRTLFSELGDLRHFIFASSCTTSPLTPWENLVYLRDAARAYGRL